MAEDWNNRKVTVLGLGRSGIATANYLAKRGAQIFLSDSSESDAEKSAQAAELEARGIKVELGKHSEEAATHLASSIITSPRHQTRMQM